MNVSPSHVSVVIPARNEEQLLRSCLRSVFDAFSLLPRSMTFDLVVAVDSSTDRTREVAGEELQRLGTVICTNAGTVGRARSVATELAIKRFCGPPELCWLANTDADCVVPETWLKDQVALAASGVDAIAGIVDVDNFEEHLPFVKDRFRATYLIGPDGSHPHVHGANLGFRADYFLRAGGWRDLATGEDHDLWNRLAQVGARRKAVSRIEVVTSGRRVGRAPHGFAEALALHNSDEPA